MKKTYETPNVEIVKFQYRDQVVVASGKIPSGRCYADWVNNESSTMSDCFIGYKGDLEGEN